MNVSEDALKISFTTVPAETKLLTAANGASNPSDILLLILLKRDPANCSVIHAPVLTTSVRASSIRPRTVSVSPLAIFDPKQSNSF